MVNIELPIHIGVDPIHSSVEVLGKKLQYSETPVHLNTILTPEILHTFREAIQFREGRPQDTVDVAILDKTQLKDVLVQIFAYNVFITDMSVEQPLVDHLSEALAVELSKNLGLSAVGSLVLIPASDSLFYGIAESLIASIESSPQMRQFLYEQYLAESPERFPPGKNDQYAPIPFLAGDTLSFFLTMRFENSVINGNSQMRLSEFLEDGEMPIVKFAVRLSFA